MEVITIDSKTRNIFISLTDVPDSSSEHLKCLWNSIENCIQKHFNGKIIASKVDDLCGSYDLDVPISLKVACEIAEELSNHNIQMLTFKFEFEHDDWGLEDPGVIFWIKEI